MAITINVVSLNPADRSKFVLRFATGCRFFTGNQVSSTNKTEHHDTTKILLQVALSTITLTLYEIFCLSLIEKALSQLYCQMGWTIDSFTPYHLLSG